MPATPSRIGFIMQEFRKAVSETSSVQTRYGSLARQSDDPIPTWFDSEADAQDVADARQALLAPERRRFRTSVVGVSEILAIDYIGAVPVATYIDDERGCNRPMLVSEIVIDLGKQSAELTLWG